MKGGIDMSKVAAAFAYAEVVSKRALQEGWFHTLLGGSFVLLFVHGPYLSYAVGADVRI